MDFEKGHTINFGGIKTFKYIKKLGSGGTGETCLLKDENLDMDFAFKKYVPKDKKYEVEFYKRFVNELKILFKVSHPNIVRIYNTYLYPKYNTGFIQMEYIDGVTIDKYDPLPWQKNWNGIFTELINTFVYLEDNEILHRDIRVNNIMIDTNDNVKIIDFGFGKDLKQSPNDENSIWLNWPVSEMPQEVKKHEKYDNVTEIYFLGKLFKNLLISKNAIEEFNYNYIIEKMIEVEPKNRYQSFKKIQDDIAEGLFSKIDFSEDEKLIYQKLADDLLNHISIFKGEYIPIYDIDKIINNLANVIKNNSLEKYLQNNQELINCFIQNNYRYSPKTNIEMSTVINFYKFMANQKRNKQKNILDNLNSRLSKIKIEEETDLPF